MAETSDRWNFWVVLRSSRRFFEPLASTTNISPSQHSFDIVVLSIFFFLPFFLSLLNTNEIVNGFRFKPESNITGSFIVGAVGRRIRFRTTIHRRQTFRKTYFRSIFFFFPPEIARFQIKFQCFLPFYNDLETIWGWISFSF